MIRQVCYLSVAHSSLSDAELQNILGAARHANRSLQLTGLLAVGGGLVFQVLEGPRDNVECVMRHIRRDRRHYGMRILQDEMIESRDFAGWPMGFRTIDAASAEFIAHRHYEQIDPVAAIVAALGNPLEAQIIQNGLKLAA